MSFRSDSLYQRLTEAQRDELMIAMMEATLDRAAVGLKLCEKWGVKASRSGVHNLFARYSFGWRLDRAAWVAKQTDSMPQYSEEEKKLVSQKLFAEAASTDADPKFLLLLRALQQDQEKIEQRERLAENRGKLERDKLSLAERKVKLLEDREAKAKAALGNEKLSPKERDARLKQIFGM